MKKRIWIDLTNSPHVVFFNPIIKRLIAEGHTVTVTAREYAQTLPLLKKYNIDYIEVGKHMGKQKTKKLMGLFKRTKDLLFFSRKKKFDLALSLGSNDMAIASFFNRIPHVTLFDYEYITAHHINLRLASSILKPEAIPFNSIKKYGARKSKVIEFKGLKEDFYINELDYNKDYISQALNISSDNIIVVFRPPATLAHYQHTSEDLYINLLIYLSNLKNVKVIILPRTDDQKEYLYNLKLKKCVIPTNVLEGHNLLLGADLVISAGGTMNREAAALNIPVYTIYNSGVMGSVDNNLIQDRRLVQINSVEDFKNIMIVKKSAKPKNSIKKLDYLELLKKAGY